MAKNKTRQKIIVIVGPTASGKSDLGIKLAKKFSGEIISADSRQVYQGMDIGTGKVLQDKTLPVPISKLKNQNSKLGTKDFYSKGVKHHLIDVVNPQKQFTANDFKRLGKKAIQEITTKGKIPIIVGGAGFYIDVLLGQIDIANVPPNHKLRAKLEKQTVERLFKLLSTFNPQRAKLIDPHNKHRLIRALEICVITKKPSPTTSYKIRDTSYEILWLGINPEKEKLAKNIKKRLDQRLKQGMIEEVKQLHKQGISWKRMGEMGLEYRQISRYLKNIKSHQMAGVSNIKQSSNSKTQILNFKKMGYYENLLKDIIKYSKRQMTWFKRNKEIRWFNQLNDEQKTERLINKFLYYS